MLVLENSFVVARMLVPLRQYTERFSSISIKKPLLRGAVLLISGICSLSSSFSPSIAQNASPPVLIHKHGLAMHGEPALPADFKAFPYANPDAPKGGRFIQALQGSFDSLNVFSIKGSSPQLIMPYVVQPLMIRSQDEPFTIYGLLAESVAVADDRSMIEFRLRKEARFSDGKPVTSADVEFSFGLLRDKGRPVYRSTYGKVARVEMADAQTIRFIFKDTQDSELPILLGLMPVFAKHALDVDKFETMGFTPLLGSGPYLVSEVEAGTRIGLKRNPNFWGAHVPAIRGYYNFDEMRFDYYRDSNTYFEAFRTGLYDLRAEVDAGRWLNGYQGQNLTEGKIVKEPMVFETPKGMTGFILNARKSQFSDIRVREALSYLLDFEWMNKNLLQGVYKRSASYFEGSELSAHHHPADARELALFQEQGVTLRPEILAGTWQPPQSDGSGRDRAMIGKAVALLSAAGYGLRNGEMQHLASNTPLNFEILVTSREKERLALAFSDGLKLVGIKPRIRLVDSSQYWSRLKNFEFECIIETYPASASPGNEQLNRWSSLAESRPGTLNYAGVKDKAVDAAIAMLLGAKDRDGLVSATRALDRLLIAGHYLVPLYYVPERWMLRWAHIGKPARWPRYDFVPDVLWRQ